MQSARAPADTAQRATMAAASVRRSSLLLVPLLASALQLRPAVTAPPPRRVLLFVDPCGDTAPSKLRPVWPGCQRGPSG